MTEPIRVGDKVQWMQFGEWLGKPFARTFFGTVTEIRNWGQGDVATVEYDDRRLLPKLLLVNELTRMDAAEPATPRVTDEGGDFSGEGL